MASGSRSGTTARPFGTRTVGRKIGHRPRPGCTAVVGHDQPTPRPIRRGVGKRPFFPATTWIAETDPEHAPPALAAAYARVGAARGWVANILRVHSLNVPALNAHFGPYRALMFGPSARMRAEREMIAVAVSAANARDYCVAHHRHALRTEGDDDALVAALAQSPECAPLDARGRALVAYALKLTRTPASVTESDVQTLRAAGVPDAGIHDAAAVTASYNVVNRMALGLGVELQPEIVA